MMIQMRMLEQEVDDVDEGDAAWRPLSRRPLTAQSGREALGLRPRRGRSAKSPAGSVHSATGVQPPASSSTPRAARAVFVAVLGVDRRALRRSGSAVPAIVNVDVARARPGASRSATGCRSSALRGGRRRPGMSPSSSRLMRSSRLRLNCGGHAFGVVIGGDQPLDRLDPVHADQQLRAGAEQVAELAQQVGRAARHEIADGRAGEEAELGQMLRCRREGRTAARSRRRPG